MNFYHKIWDIEARVLPRKNRHKKGIDWYLDRGLDPKWQMVLHEVREKMLSLLFDEGVTFGMWIENATKIQYAELEKIMQEKTGQYRLTKRDGRGYFQFALAQPDYKIKEGRLYSREAQRIYQEVSSLMNLIIKGKSYNCSEGRQLFLKFKESIQE